jgi:hypothetical protein
MEEFYAVCYRMRTAEEGDEFRSDDGSDHEIDRINVQASGKDQIDSQARVNREMKMKKGGFIVPRGEEEKPGRRLLAHLSRQGRWGSVGRLRMMSCFSMWIDCPRLKGEGPW